ncbi:hypothetical protein P153DRAFT_97480 [Dothidotthia symphoricarpi CBS 119687]|uniref:Uncharacterized protein n=1 Tax=Dothidotthia symphoricarpi CBS 119687 TaxID=1392245 RepID=A0A6A6AS99_9PLEO|nr:uncharacterized protein P153DRAFT_97480 [Dothidotthia symphoricarpi CBS 119687]KAF2133717.1 hypothetical protein P153DRAFT_97480 [Dothidotthia symphoricarpi CBS 119687]
MGNYNENTAQDSSATGMSSASRSQPGVTREGRPAAVVERDGTREGRRVSNYEQGPVQEAGPTPIFKFGQGPVQEAGPVSFIKLEPGLSGDDNDAVPDVDHGPAASSASKGKGKGKSPAQYAWESESLTLEQRVSAFNKFTTSAAEMRRVWEAGGKPACPACGVAHPPPCVPQTGGRKAAMRLGTQLQRDLSAARKRDLDTPAQGKGQKSKYMFCKNCAKTHIGGASECKAPLCRTCSLNHFSSERCSSAVERFRAAGLLKRDESAAAQPSRGQGKQPDKSKQLLTEEDLEMMAAMMASASTDQAGALAQLLNHLGEKRKAEAEALESEEAQPPPKKTKKAESEDTSQKSDGNANRPKYGGRKGPGGASSLNGTPYSHR